MGNAIPVRWLCAVALGLFLALPAICRANDSILGWKKDTIMLRAAPGEAPVPRPRTQLPPSVAITDTQGPLVGFIDPATGVKWYVNRFDITSTLPATVQTSNSEPSLAGVCRRVVGMGMTNGCSR